MPDTIKISRKDAAKLADAISRVTATGQGGIAAAAIIQAICEILPDSIPLTAFRTIANNGVIDLSGRNYLANMGAK